jgi:hypothetical protein
VAVIEVGKTYVFTGEPVSYCGRKALVLAVEGDVLRVRWPNGMESFTFEARFGEEVEPAIPGVDEPCLTCVGTKTVPITEADPEHPWLRHRVGEEPCPNCGHVP